MVVNLLNNIKLSGHNEHLTDIFTENCYLELGNIHYHLLRRLLEYEEIDFKDVCSFDILNSGLGKSRVDDEELKNLLPFYFFKNINTKNSNIQIFLTYGLFSYTKNNVEKFAPLVLIPVNTFLKEDTITFQMLSKPIENRELLEEINIPNKLNIRLDNLVNLDRYVLGFENIDGCHVSFESYLTFAKSRTVNLRLDHKAFSFRKDSTIDLKSIKGVSQNSETFGVDPLSKLQRQALVSARNGNSFAISGRVGTGKTTALINIALDQMSEGKKVLYVSNVKETKKQLEKKLKSLKADSFYMDLTVPFSELPQFVYNSSKTEDVDDKELVKQIIEKYDEISDYESKLFGRVCDFRYNEILSELAVLSTKQLETKSLDDLTVIYKHEYEQILDSIKIISDKVKKLKKLGVQSISESKFSEIPTNLESYLLDNNSILKVLGAIRDLFGDLLTIKQTLEKKYGFNSIPNFGRLGFIRIYVDGLNVDEVPKSWLESTGEVFKKAQEKYYDLDRDMNILRDMYADLDEHYRNLDEISIDYEINQILSNVYKISDGAKIDLINERRNEINKLINRGGVEKETFLNVTKKIRSFMKINLNDEIKNINEMVRFADYVCENRVDPVWVKYLNEEFLHRSIPKISESKKFIEEFNALHKRFEKRLPKFPVEEIPNLLVKLKSYEQETSAKRRKQYAQIHAYRKKNNITSFKEEIAILEELCTYLKDINLHISRYEKLVGHKYILGDDPISGITKLCDYVKTIKNQEMKKRIIDYISQKEWNFNLDANASNNAAFNLYRYSYRNLIDIYEELHKYVPLKNQSKMTPILNDMMNAFEYFRKIFSSNDRLKERIIDFKEPYVPVEEYLILKDKLNNLYNHEQMLIHNEEYKFLYDMYYLDIDTDCNEIAKILEFFNLYTQIFKNYGLVVKSLEYKRRSEITEIFSQIRSIFELMGLNITTYNTIFKNSFAISYYSNSFSEVIKYLERLLDSKEELSLYLDLVNALQVIMKYNLFRWVNYLTHLSDVDSIVDEFKLSYFTVISKMYLESNAMITQQELLEKLSTLSIELKLMSDCSKKSTLNKIKKSSIYRANAKFTGDYDEYLNKISNVKKIFFVDTTLLNNYISISHFDIVLVDDVQAGSSSDYGIALRANQVVFAGVEQLQTLFSSDVISRMRKSNVLSLRQRYYPTPKHLVNNMDGASSVIQSNKPDNIGVELLKIEPEVFTLSLFEENKNYKINVYCANLTTKREFYEKFAEYGLKNGLDKMEILRLLTENVNVCDVCEEYLVDSDYNIVYLDEYSSIKFDNNATNMFDFILQTKKRLFIYDEKNILNDNSENVSVFISKVKLLLETSSDVFNKLNDNQLVMAIAKVFRSRKIKVFDHHDGLDLLLEYKNKLYGVIIYFNHDISSLETVSTYLEDYKVYSQNGMKVYNVMLYDLKDSLVSKIEEICEDIVHE